MTKIIYDAVSTMEMYRRKINGHKEKIEALEHEMACLDSKAKSHPVTGQKAFSTG